MFEPEGTVFFGTPYYPFSIQTGRSRDAFPWLSDVRFGSGGYVYTVDASETPSMGLVYLPT